MVLRWDPTNIVIAMFSWWMYRSRHRKRSVSFKKYVDFVLYEQDSDGATSRVSFIWNCLP